MGQDTKIEWTDNTFNPWQGCIKVSPGCENCYALTLSNRWGKDIWGPGPKRERTSRNNWDKPTSWDRKAKKEGKRYKVFCASMADVFEDNKQVREWRLDLFMLISNTPNLDWQILTKRPDIARTFFEQRPGLLFPNIWLGTSIEDQKRANERIPHLLQIPASVRFLSIEPLLGPVSFDLIDGVIYDGGMPFEWQRLSKPGIDWVIVGGESGPNARPMNPQWARSIRDQCTAAGIAYFFKQWGEWGPAYSISGDRMVKVGKHTAGRLLDGRTWNEMPKAAHP